MNGPSIIKFITILTECSRNNNVDLKHLKKLNMKLIIITSLLQLLQTCLKHMIVSSMNLSLLNQMLAVSIVRHLNLCLLI